MKKNDVQYYADQGIFISLDEYGVRDCPNIKAALEEFPTMAEALECSDGKFYVLPEVNNAIHNTYRGGRLHYYMPWFRDNDIAVPQTLDEFTEYLRWVKTSDANGKPNEIPLAFWKDEAIVRNTISALAKPFMPWVMTDTYWGLAVEDGVVTEQYRDERFRDALRYMNMLYKEGQIMENSFSISQDELRAIGESEEGPAIAVIGAFGADGHVQRGGPRWAGLMEWAIPDEYFIPPMALSPEDNARVADINAVLDPFKLQAFSEFITGARDIESGWDAYLAELDGMGSTEMVEIMQKYYDGR